MTEKQMFEIMYFFLTLHCARKTKNKPRTNQLYSHDYVHRIQKKNPKVTRPNEYSAVSRDEDQVQKENNQV